MLNLPVSPRVEQQNYVNQHVKQLLGYDRVYEIIMHHEQVVAEKYRVDLPDVQWQAMFLEIFRGRKTYAGAIIKELQKSCL